MTKEFKINDYEFNMIIENALNDPLCCKIAEEILMINNFTAFKNMMIGKNNELENEAKLLLKKNENFSNNYNNSNNDQTEKLRKEKEKTEIQHVIIN